MSLSVTFYDATEIAVRSASEHAGTTSLVIKVTAREVDTRAFATTELCFLVCDKMARDRFIRAFSAFQQAWAHSPTLTVAEQSAMAEYLASNTEDA